MTQHQAALLKAIERAGGQEALAKAINVPQSTISFWLNKAKKGVAGEKVAEVERITLVPRHELRPDLFAPPESTTKAPEPQDAASAPRDRAKGHFSRYRHLRRDHFKSAEEIERHIAALREEWAHR